MRQLPALPYAPAVTALSGSGATTYSYMVTSCTHEGETTVSAAGTCTNAATLDVTHVNRVTWVPLQGASAYKVYGRSSGTEELMATVTWDDLHDGLNVTAPPHWDDNGSATPSGAQPSENTTGNLAVGGNAGVGAAASAAAILTLAAGTAAKSQIALPTSVAPTSPNDGDVWREDNTNTGLKIRINGVTKTIVVA